jgi:hypothetical protein
MDESPVCPHRENRHPADCWQCRRRERIATAALQGFAANSQPSRLGTENKEMAEWAVNAADRLIAALDAQPSAGEK